MDVADTSMESQTTIDSYKSMARLPEALRPYNVLANITNDTQDNFANSDGPPYWNPSTRIIMACFLSVFLIAAAVGNSMVLSIIIRHKGMRTRTNMFLASLAVADLLVAILDMPFSLITIISGDWILGQHFCVFNGFTMSVFLITSIHTLMYISIHKYITITRPFSRVLTFRRILFMIAAAWLWAIFCATTTVTGLTSVEYKPETTQCGPVYPNTTTAYIQSGIVTLGCYIIPLLIMCVSYICMTREIVGYSARLKQHSNQEIDTIMRQQKRIILTLFIVVAIFICCWTPYVTYSIYVTNVKDKNDIPELLNAMVYWCGYMNSACNPIVYALRSPSFREGYKEIFCQGPAYITDDMLDTLRDESPNPLRRFGTFIRSSFRSSTSVRGRQSTAFGGSVRRTPSLSGNVLPINMSRSSLMKLAEANGKARTRRMFLRSESLPSNMMRRARTSLPARYASIVNERNSRLHTEPVFYPNGDCPKKYQNGALITENKMDDETYVISDAEEEDMVEYQSMIKQEEEEGIFEPTEGANINQNGNFTLGDNTNTSIEQTGSSSDDVISGLSIENKIDIAEESHKYSPKRLIKHVRKLFKSEEHILEDFSDNEYLKRKKSASESELDAPRFRLERTPSLEHL